MPLPSGATVVAESSPKASIEQWIVAGMTIPVTIDPRQPARCEIDMGGVPPLADRIAARDPALCALEEVALRVRETEERLRRADAPIPAGVFEKALSSADESIAARRAEDVRAALARRLTAERVDGDGRLRGTADLISYERKPASRGNLHDDAGWKGRRLVRVWPFGHDPYVVVERARLALGDHRTFLAGGVPVSDSRADPTDFRYLWEEYDHDPAAAQRDRSRDTLARETKAAADIQTAALKASLDATPPEMRAALAAQLRAAGMHIPEEWL